MQGAICDNLTEFLMFLMDRKGPPTSMKDIERDQCGFVAKMTGSNSKNGTPRD